MLKHHPIWDALTVLAALVVLTAVIACSVGPAQPKASHGGYIRLQRLMASLGVATTNPVTVVDETVEVRQPDNPSAPATLDARGTTASTPPAYRPPDPPTPDPRAGSFNLITWAGIAFLAAGVALFALRAMPWTAAFFAWMPTSAPMLLGLVGAGLLAAPSFLLAIPWWVWTGCFLAIVVPGILANLGWWQAKAKPADKPDTD